MRLNIMSSVTTATVPLHPNIDMESAQWVNPPLCLSWCCSPYQRVPVTFNFNGHEARLLVNSNGNPLPKDYDILYMKIGRASCRERV